MFPVFASTAALLLDPLIPLYSLSFYFLACSIFLRASQDIFADVHFLHVFLWTTWCFNWTVV
jgi:hypothetical protein